MRFHRGPLAAAGLLALASTPLAVASDDARPGADDRATLSYQAQENWSIILPRETWHAADPYCGIAHANDEQGFATEQTGVMALEIDTNGDGKLDDKVKGARGYAKLRGKTEAGDAFTYAVRFKFEGKAFKWAPSGAMVGKLKGQVFKVIDQDGDGTYDDYGIDAMVIGSTDAASFLSKVVNVGGELFELEINADGSQVTTKPYQGESGILDLASGFTSNGTLVAAVVASGDLSFNVADAALGMRVPAGSYELASGFVEKAGETVWSRRGKSTSIDVKAGETRRLEWGGPIVAEFDYKVSGETITVQPDVKFYGAFGEEYFQFWPEAKSPKILVTDKATGKLVASGRFGGC
jgi:hypothetical protein